MDQHPEKHDLANFDNVIFDLGDVIIDIDFDLTIKAFADISKFSFDEVTKMFTDLRVYDQYERGQFTDAQFRDYMRVHFKLENTDQEIDDAWNALLLDLPKERVDLVQKIGATKRTFLLSNTSNIHIVKTNKILEQATGVRLLKDLVEKAYFSYEINLRKPDLDIYEFVLKDANLNPSKTLFIDDNYDNVIGSRKAGITTLHLQPDNDIRKALII